MRTKVTDAAPEELQATFDQFRTIMLGFKGRFKATLAAHDLTFPQWMVILRVQKAGRLTVRELAESCDVTPPNITGIVDRLERDGIVTRSRSEEDKRVVFVRLTEKGHRKFATVEAAGTQEVLREGFAGWSAEDLAALRALLARVRFPE